MCSACLSYFTQINLCIRVKLSHEKEKDKCVPATSVLTVEHLIMSGSQLARLDDDGCDYGWRMTLRRHKLHV